MSRKTVDVSLRRVGARLREARKESGLRAYELAEKAGVDPPRVSRFETGKKGLETESFLRLLAAAHSVGINLDYVILGVGQPIRDLVALAEDERVVETLIGLARRLETVRSSRDLERKPPRASGDNE